MNIDDVFIYKSEFTKYDNQSFNPSTRYKELINMSFDIKSDQNIYNDLRNLLITMKFDKNNIGTSKWNPFGDFIKHGDNVVIKPNLVKHVNKCINGNMDSLITNIALIRPIIDYCLLALDNTGSLIIGDAPVQECDFNQLITDTKMDEMIKKYQNKYQNVFLLDFRSNTINNNLKYKIVNVGNDSELCEVDKYSNKYAITNYNLKYMHEHHKEGIHEYLIPEKILSADVIINMPKPKTHRKAGITACMKNIVGINGKKEYLPHHRNGSIKENGDEYPENNLLKKINSNLKNYSYKHNIFITFIRRGCSILLKLFKLNRFQEGSWYGNDTIWRTILDLNKLLLYADINGTMKKEKQRIVFNVVDMIISGEGEGPLLPSNKTVGYILSSFNSLNCDNTICQIMGFNPNKIKYIEHGYTIKKYNIVKTKKYSNYDKNGRIIKLNKLTIKFKPTDGWKDYLNEK